MQGRASGAVREFALYGETTGETDEFGLPVRYDWAADYRGHGDGRLRPHAGARGRVAQQHDLHRHRLRLRRQAHRAALPRARAGLGARRGRPTTSRRAVPAATPRRRCRRSSAHDDVLDLDDVARQADRRHAPAAHGHDPRGERRRGARGDEPLRGRPALAGLPAADDVAVRDQRSGPGCSSTRPRRSPTSARDGVAAGRLRGEAHGLARGRGRLPRRRQPPRRGSASTTASAASSTRAPAGRSSTTPRLEAGAARRACARPSTRPACGTSSRPTGCCSTAELMPWSAKAQELLREQYAAGRRGRGRAALAATRRVLAQATARGVDVGELLDRSATGADDARALRRGLPALLLAGRRARRPAARAVPRARDRGRASFVDRRPPLAHGDAGDRLAAATIRAARATRRRDGRPRPTPRAVARGVAWWEELTGAGGEGMVVKPLRRSSRAARRGSCSRRSSAAAASTCGSSTARSTPSPSTSSGCAAAASAASARSRCASSRSASRRWSASCAREPLRRVHECVFGVLALESEPVDPRL